MVKQINTVEYWSKKWGEKKTSGNYGQNQYYFLAKYLPMETEFTCLDLGCGRGAGIEFLAKMFTKAKFLGIDFSDVAVNDANVKLRRFDNASFQCGDIYKMPFEFQKFDYILMIELLEHLRWPGKILEKFIPMCNKIIYISIPSTNWECDEHIYAYGKSNNPFENHGSEVLGNMNGRKKLKIEVNK